MYSSGSSSLVGYSSLNVGAMDPTLARDSEVGILLNMVDGRLRTMLCRLVIVVSRNQGTDSCAVEGDTIDSALADRVAKYERCTESDVGVTRKLLDESTVAQT